MDYDHCQFVGLTQQTAEQISRWAYAEPYAMYSHAGRPNGYLMDRATWGVEQFCLLMQQGEIAGLVCCQYEGDKLWVGWALSPDRCGKGSGHQFIRKCIQEIRKCKGHGGALYLRVAASNRRAIRAYEKAGFSYLKTIQDEVAYTDKIEDFHVMINV